MKAIYISLIAMVLTSCEDVVEINLNSTEPGLVVEGIINIDSRLSEVSLTKTADYFNPGENTKVSGASVVLTSEPGVIHILNESSPGRYSIGNLELENTNSWSISITTGGSDYSAMVQLPGKVEIRSLSFEPSPGYMEFTGGSLVSCQLVDPADIHNFYRYRVFALSDNEFREEKFNVFDDEFVDGNEISMRWEEEQFFPGDTVVVELRSIDEASYDYYLSVNSLLEGSFVGSATPANPKTNIVGDALGYFGAYSISRDTIIIQ